MFTLCYYAAIMLLLNVYYAAINFLYYYAAVMLIFKVYYANHNYAAINFKSILCCYYAAITVCWVLSYPTSLHLIVQINPLLFKYLKVGYDGVSMVISVERVVVL